MWIPIRRRRRPSRRFTVRCTGGANEEVLRMLMEIGSIQKVPEFIKV